MNADKHAENGYYASLASNAAQDRYAGATQSQASPPRPPTAVGQISSQVEQHNEALSAVTHRLENLIERLAGPQPCDPASAKTEPGRPPHAIAMVESHLRAQASLIARLNAASNVLDNLA